MKVSGTIVDIPNRKLIKGEIEIREGRIISIVEKSDVPDQFILPGFVDAHVHIESSMLVPSEFARMAVVHGTVATISDPHEIGNVLGLEGVEYMIENGSKVPFKFYFGAPSCVPATTFETAGAAITIDDIRKLFARDEIKYLAEMMNWPGVLNRDADVMAKIELAIRSGKVVDGHAPGLRGDHARQYISAGISTDHECFTADEALDKLNLGMKILIREGSAAKNFEALIGLMHDHSANMMFCSDDKHPDSLEEGHINQLVVRALKKGIDVFKILQAACINPVTHYKLDVGLLRVGDPADFIIVDNLNSFTIKETFINGQLVAGEGKSKINIVEPPIVNRFNIEPKRVTDFALTSQHRNVRVIEALDGELITRSIEAEAILQDGNLVSNVKDDILKIVVVNRYYNAPVAISFIRNFGLKRGALASSVAHDSHNIVAVGVSDELLCKAVNAIIETRGGVVAVDETVDQVLPLPVAGLMSERDGYEIAKAYKKLDAISKDFGSNLKSPFMTLSFMALLVIPSLKLSDKGLFDGDHFRFVDPIAK
ncbi:MAG TPA: adenine deaminase [Chryseosolibacter sp.]